MGLQELVDELAASDELYKRLDRLSDDLDEFVFRPMSREYMALLHDASNAAGMIKPTSLRLVKDASDNIINRFIFGGSSQNIYWENSLEKPAAFQELLRKHITEVQFDVVSNNAKFFRRTLDDQVFEWMSDWDLPEGNNLNTSPLSLNNPFAKYEEAHLWVDPRGYRLSDRIWDTDEEMRRRLHAFLDYEIKQGRGAYSMSKDLEWFLQVGRNEIKTYKPYGRKASFDAMRLARTEISRAHTTALDVVMQSNPYVDAIDYCLSGSHPKVDICDNWATINMHGNRIKKPYPKKRAHPQPVISSHPQCLCHLRPVVSATPEDVTKKLRATMEAGYPPPITPANPQKFLRLLNSTWYTIAEQRMKQLALQLAKGGV